MTDINLHTVLKAASLEDDWLGFPLDVMVAD